MSLSILAAASRVVAHEQNQLAESTRRLVSVRDQLDATRRKRATNDIDALLAQPVGQLWLEIVALDANHPELPQLEALMLRFFQFRTNILSDIRTMFRRMQQKKRAASPSGGAFRGALDRSEVDQVLAELTGR
jgi:hypothetical protein